jgi:hypothetical protein
MSHINVPVFTAQANTGTSNSAEIDASYLSGATVQAYFTDGATTGTLKLQSSNDPGTPTHWNDIASATAAVAAGATTTTPLVAAQFQYRWIRAVFISTGGAGTFSANLQAQGFQ